MESGFVYSSYVTGKNFIGRRGEVSALGNLIRQGENVILQAPPKTGKRSLVHQACFNLRVEGEQFNIVELSLLSVRDISEFVLKMGSELIKMTGNTPEEYEDSIARYLPGTHFIFDEQTFESRNLAVALDGEPDSRDIREIFTLPYKLAEVKGSKFVVIVEEFQNIMLAEGGEEACGILEDIFNKLLPEGRKRACYVLCGSRINAMKEMFDHRRMFFRTVERLDLNPVSNKEICEHAIRTFLTTGKVIDKDLMTGVCILFKGNLWYINHFCAICDSLSKGYIMEPVLNSALERLCAIHEPGFSAIMNDLTTFQVSLLKAILEGNTKFCSTEVIERYKLNSSANVKRLREALCKKEIIFFDEEDQPVIIDPMFEYWAKKYYFGIE